MKYSKEQLYNLSIYEVRKIGQLEGVKSPTSLKKDELIDEIIAISSGIKERYVPTSKKGRPSKAFKELDFLRTFEVKKEDNKKLFFDSSLEVCAPNLGEEAIYKLATQPAGEFEGYVDTLNGDFGIVKPSLKDDDFVFLTSSIIKENNLKKGDFIKVSALKLGNGKKFADKIISSPKNQDRADFISLPPVYPNKQIVFNNCNILNKLSPIGVGQRAVIACDDESLLFDIIFKLFNECKENKILIILGCQPEEKEKFKDNENIVCIETAQELSIGTLAVNIMHRKAEQGENCAVFVSGISNYNFSNTAEILHDVMQAFKNTKDAGSVALVAGASKKTLNEISSSFNLIIPLDEKLSLYGINFPIDVNSISLNRKDGLLSDSNLDAIKKAKIASLSSLKELVDYLLSL